MGEKQSMMHSVFSGACNTFCSHSESLVSSIMKEASTFSFGASGREPYDMVKEQRRTGGICDPASPRQGT